MLPDKIQDWNNNQCQDCRADHAADHPQLSRLLDELAESAALMAAYKFVMLHSRLVETKSLTRAQLPNVVAGFHDLEAMLPARAASSPNEEPPAHGFQLRP